MTRVIFTWPVPFSHNVRSRLLTIWAISLKRALDKGVAEEGRVASK